MTSKHPKTQPQDRPRSDLDVDPGIGRSKGATMADEDPRDLDGGVDQNRMGRTNK